MPFLDRDPSWLAGFRTSATPSRSIRLLFIMHSGLRENTRRIIPRPEVVRPRANSIRISHRSQSWGLTMGRPFLPMVQDDSHENDRAFVFWRITHCFCMFLVRFERPRPTGLSNDWPCNAGWPDDQDNSTLTIIYPRIGDNYPMPINETK